MEDQTQNQLKQQHLIDPEVCIRCNTCEATCPIGAITHDDRNYVVNVEICNSCMACIPPCPTGAIDNWRSVLSNKAYSITEQLSWDILPQETEPVAEEGSTPLEEKVVHTQALSQNQAHQSYGSHTPPWSAAHPYVQLYGSKGRAPYIVATVSGNVCVTEATRGYATHHIVLDFGQTPFPVLEGQSIGVLYEESENIKTIRQYSVSSPRHGERPGYNNLSITVKRVVNEVNGATIKGKVSNYLCDLKVGDRLHIVGPYGTSFLMPNHPGSHIIMICTGTGSAPMRAMTEWRRRLRNKAIQQTKNESQANRSMLEQNIGKLMLFFGARTQEELPYFGPLQTLPHDFIDINLAFSRTPNQVKQYVQDLLRLRAKDILAFLENDNAYFYVCGLRDMEEGVILTLKDIVQNAGLDWHEVATRLQKLGRLHLETY